MNTRLPLLAATGLLFAASAVHAAPSELQRYADRAMARADTLLTATGVDFQTQPVSVRASVDLDGRISGVRVLRSSGSPRTDHAVEAVLRRIVRADPPLGLTNGAVTLNAGRAPVAAAKAP
jgi:TonB family protein